MAVADSELGIAALYDRPVPAPSTDERPLSALPSPMARALAFAAILLAGLCGALIGWSFVDLQCEGNCTTPGGIGALVGGLFGAIGVSVVAVLTLRAMAEWKRIKAEELYNTEATDPDRG
jgi:hypothetical protein